MSRELGTGKEPTTPKPGPKPETKIGGMCPRHKTKVSLDTNVYVVHTAECGCRYINSVVNGLIWDHDPIKSLDDVPGPKTDLFGGMYPPKMPEYHGTEKGNMPLSSLDDPGTWRPGDDPLAPNSPYNPENNGPNSLLTDVRLTTLREMAEAVETDPAVMDMGSDYKISYQSHGAKPRNKYQKVIKGIDGKPLGLVDVYSVLSAFNITEPGLQHALKKLLMPGQRGKGSFTQDLKEAVQAIERTIVDQGIEFNPAGIPNHTPAP